MVTTGKLKFFFLFSEQEQPLFVAVDCEMDRSLDSNVLVKITVVDDAGRLILDTLVNPGVPITQSCFQIHGIRPEWLVDAPLVS
jgi:DNA polymerase III epsilon subunit-like protein